MVHIVILLPRELAALPDGREWRGPDALDAAARALIGDGANADAKLVVLRDGRPVLEGRLCAFAGRAWAGASRDPAFQRWRPHPHARLPPPLVRWATENGFLRPGRYSPTGNTLEAAGDAPAQGRE